jgi:hypothetical protein
VVSHISKIDPARNVIMKQTGKNEPTHPEASHPTFGGGGGGGGGGEKKKAGVDMGLFLIPHIPLPSSPPLSFPFLC